jgi:hypothetical protein
MSRSVAGLRPYLTQNPITSWNRASAVLENKGNTSFRRHPSGCDSLGFIGRMGQDCGAIGPLAIQSCGFFGIVYQSTI